MPQTWFDLASDARRTANRLVDESPRSCLNRAYYAAFSKVNHALVGVPGLTIKLGREGVNHPGESGTGGIRRWIISHMPNVEPQQRVKLSELVGRLYTLRVSADYKPSVEVDARDAREAPLDHEHDLRCVLRNNMPTAPQITDIVDKVRNGLTEAERTGIHLKIVSHKLDDGWLYIVVVPSKPGVRASDYANFMSKIERELRAQGDDQVLLVPALED